MSPKKKAQLREALMVRTGGRCDYCGHMTTGFAAPHSDNRRTMLDHVIPRSKNGGDNEANLRLVCGFCNFSKCDRSLEEFREYCRWCGSMFTPAQHDYLDSLGFNVPRPAPYVFHFERVAMAASTAA